MRYGTYYNCINERRTIFVEGLNDEELNFFNALMSSPKDLSDQVNNVKTEVVK